MTLEEFKKNLYNENELINKIKEITNEKKDIDLVKNPWVKYDTYSGSFEIDKNTIYFVDDTSFCTIKDNKSILPLWTNTYTRYELHKNNEIEILGYLLF